MCSAGLLGCALWLAVLRPPRACRWSVYSLKISICSRRHQTSRLTAFYRVMVYLYHLRVKSRLAWNLTVSRLCCAVVWYYGKIARLDVWYWRCAVGWFGGLVDRLECYAVDRLKGLWISKGRIRVRELYPQKNYPQRTYVLRLRPRV